MFQFSRNSVIATSTSNGKDTIYTETYGTVYADEMQMRIHDKPNTVIGVSTRDIRTYKMIIQTLVQRIWRIKTYKIIIIANNVKMKR